MKNLQSRYGDLAAKNIPYDEEVEIEDNFVKTLREFVEKNLSTVKPRDLDGVFYMSTSSFIRKLRAVTGKTPSMFIKLIRLQTSKELLKNTDDSISEIVYKIGFSSPEYFSNQFRELFGLTPTEYRNGSKPS